MHTVEKKPKSVRDSVHGIIEIPDAFFASFIDTPIFQRLRYIEQTSMRSLFPSAHHDRFIHSLGVYHLGKTAIDCLMKNDTWNNINKEDWAQLRNSFEIACLLHDCAHAPFSHTFEGFYDHPLVDNPNSEGRFLENQLLLTMEAEGDTGFKKDYTDVKAKPHEEASAITAIKIYGTAIKSQKGKPSLVARMIVGCPYSNENKSESREHLLANCLITLLNNDGVDVDKLDYIVRDVWASGIKNVPIDVDKINTILSALAIKDNQNGTPVIVFDEGAAHAVSDVILGRNFLFEVIHSHHKVLYDQYLLKHSVEMLFEKLAEKSEAEKMQRAFFSLEAIHKADQYKDYGFFRPTDGDLMYLLKCGAGKFKLDLAGEWLSRKHKRKPVWKTYKAYSDLFKNSNNLQFCLNNVNERLSSFCYSNDLDPDNIVIEVTPKTFTDFENLIFETNEGRMLFKDVIKKLHIDHPPPLPAFCYIYTTSTLDAEKRKNLIHSLTV